MKIKNTSRLANEQILPLIQYICRFSDLFDDAFVEVRNAPNKSVFTNGYARLFPNNQKLVQIHVPVKDKEYPIFNRHPVVSEVGEVEIRDYDEEFLFVMAHELRHVAQFNTGCYQPGREYEMEVDAERFAVAILARYRLAMTETQDWPPSVFLFDNPSLFALHVSIGGRNGFNSSF